MSRLCAHSHLDRSRCAGASCMPISESAEYSRRWYGFVVPDSGGKHATVLSRLAFGCELASGCTA